MNIGGTIGTLLCLLNAGLSFGAEPLAENLIRESVRPTIIAHNEATALRFVYGDEPPPQATSDLIRRQRDQIELCAAYMLTMADQTNSEPLKKLAYGLLAIRKDQKSIAGSIELPDAPGAAAEWLLGSIIAGSLYQDDRQAEDFRIRSAIDKTLSQVGKWAKFRSDIGRLQRLETDAIMLTRDFLGSKDGEGFRPLNDDEGVPAKLLAEHFKRTEAAVKRLNGEYFYKTLIGKRVEGEDGGGAWTFDPEDQFISLTIRNQRIEGHCLLSEITVVAVGSNAGRREIRARCAHAISKSGQPVLLGVK